MAVPGDLTSVRDIIGFHRSGPQNVSPTEIRKLASVKFKWHEKITATSEQYVKGVVAGHDHARREITDELKKYLADKPTSPEEAYQRWGGLLQRAETMPCPSTHNQMFDD